MVQLASAHKVERLMPFPKGELEPPPTSTVAVSTIRSISSRLLSLSILIPSLVALIFDLFKSIHVKNQTVAAV
ncbi:hypothetical protein M408DRAFT_326100 [Serendipita vermifera MAFF 305830]|uniref:Uncharacterized protein n=1 Tax=Serendipita vermifera MAFF 305830 TaxID=933852 RepID=A0A0C3B962_SERVB|nr:hypothetical protein M408DRAFT_326100 [Serendipita vermifera MAFF 305830]